MGERRASRGSRGSRRAPRARRHTVAAVLVASLVVLAVVTGLGTVLVYRHLDSNLGTFDADGQLKNRPPEGPSGALNVLVLGSDTRKGQGNKIDGEKPGGSDTTILMHLAADRKSAYGISIPRDSVVDRPACTAKNGDAIPAADAVLWNAAYEVGGPACTIQQFEQLTGIRVDNTVIVDFSGFKAMVDAVGGVQICSPEAIDDPKSGLDLEPGTQTISGDEALAYVRARETVGDGSDLGRIKRQQAFIAAMAASVVSGRVLANPVTAFNLAEAVTKAIDTDFDSLRGLVGLGYQFRGVGLGRIQFVTVPVADYPEDRNHVEWTDAAQALWAKVGKDAPLGELRDQAITAADQPSAPAGSAGPSASPSPSGSPSGSASPSGSPSAPGGLDADAREDVGLCS